tara:strand:- start:328 stop:591 length:264 start_codon:yes stop_codon:yes gene_type:complete
MTKVINFLFLLLVLIFFSLTYRYYSSNKNIEAKDFNRNNISEIINTKVFNLPVLNNDTSNVIEFNDGYTKEIKNEKPRSFWNLLKTE